MDEQENNQRSAEIEAVKEKVYLLSNTIQLVGVDTKKEKLKGLLNTITALAYRWGYRKGYHEGWAKAKEGTTCRSCESYKDCPPHFIEEGKCYEYKKKEGKKK